MRWTYNKNKSQVQWEEVEYRNNIKVTPRTRYTCTELVIHYIWYKLKVGRNRGLGWYAMDFQYGTDRPTLHFVRSPFNSIIDKGTFTNNSTEIIFPVHSLTFSTTHEYNASLPEQYKDFYKETESYSSSKTYTNVDKWYGILGCTYFPIVVLDYSSVFKYL